MQIDDDSHLRKIFTRYTSRSPSEQEKSHFRTKDQMESCLDTFGIRWKSLNRARWDRTRKSLSLFLDTARDDVSRMLILIRRPWAIAARREFPGFAGFLAGKINVLAGVLSCPCFSSNVFIWVTPRVIWGVKRVNIYILSSIFWQE